MIVLARIDDRLIHGQVTVGWSRFLQVEKIAVISDEYCADEVQRSLLGMAVPEGIDFDLDSVEGIAAKMEDETYVARRTLLLAAAPREYRRLVVDHGIAISEVNLGGQRYEGGRHKVAEAILLTDEALDDLRALRAAGVAIDVRTIPTVEKRDLFELLEKAGI